jgi:beta-glucanase (GH16 family)
MRIVITIALCLIVSLAKAKPPGKGHSLVFEDEFDGASIDTKRWKVVEGPRKGAVNTARALSIKGGILRITTFTEDGKHLTGFLSTDGRFEQVQGYFEARIRFSSVPGMWSAFWMMPKTYGRSKDPAKADIDGVEIDIVEHLTQFGGHFDSTIHWGGYGAPHQRTRTQRNKPAKPANEGWHTYAVEWTGKGYRFFYDDALTWSAPADIPVSRAPQHLLVTSEVKDGSWAGKVPPGGFGTVEKSKAWMEVDWVRAWRLDGAN